MEDSVITLINTHSVLVKTMHSLVDIHSKTRDELDNVALALSATKIENSKIVHELKILNKKLEDSEKQNIFLLRLIKEASQSGTVLDYESLFKSKENGMVH